MDSGNKILICTDCLFLLAHGEGPDKIAEALAERWPNGTLALGGEHEGFGWCSCEGCGSPLGGERFAAYDMRGENA